MLQTIRDKIQGIIAWIIVGLIIIPFALWGVQEYLGLNKAPVVAEIDGLEISKDTLQNRFLAQKQAMGSNYNPELFNDDMMKGVILEQMLERQAIINRIKDSGFRIGETQLGLYIRKMPQFQGPNGFNQANYRNFVLMQGMDVLSYEESIRMNMMKSQLSDGIANSSFITNQERQYYATLKLQQRDIAYVVIKAEDYADKVNISDEEIQAYYDDHMDQYVNPAQIQVEYVQLSLADISAKQTVSDAEVKQAYEDKKARYTTVEQRKIRHILIQVPITATAEQQEEAKKKADDIYAQLQKGAKFEDMVKQHSDDAGSVPHGGDLGYVTRGMNNNPVIDDAIFSLKPGGYTKPIKSDFGYQIIKLDEIKPEKVKPFKEVKDELTKELQQTKAEALFSQKTDDLVAVTNDDLTDLTPVAEQLGMQLHTTALFSRGAVPMELQDPKIQSLIFDDTFIEQGYNSSVLEAGKNVLLVVRVKQYVPESHKALDEVKTQIVAELTKNKSEQIAIAAVDDMIARLNSGSDFAGFATGEKLTYTQNSGLKRNSSEGISPVLVAKAFAMNKPGKDGKPVYAQVQLPDGNIALVALYAVHEEIDLAQTASVDNELRSNTQATESILANEHMKYSADITRYPQNY